MFGVGVNLTPSIPMDLQDNRSRIVLLSQLPYLKSVCFSPLLLSLNII